MRGKFPDIFDDEYVGIEAKKLYEDAQELLAYIVREKKLTAKGIYGIFPAHSDGDDIVIYGDDHYSVENRRFHLLRQQSEKTSGEPNKSLADYVAPKQTGLPDTIGAFAVTTGIGLEALVAEFKAQNDDYNAIMASALADRLAEAFAEALHKEIRDEWGYGKSENLTPDDLIREKYRGIRPAWGYPACPDHTERLTLWGLLDVEETIGITLTSSLAMYPGASVSGIYLAHPQAQYFAVGKIDRDQVIDYAARKKWPIEEVERWCAPVLNYDPAAPELPPVLVK